MKCGQAEHALAKRFKVIGSRRAASSISISSLLKRKSMEPQQRPISSTSSDYLNPSSDVSQLASRRLVAALLNWAKLTVSTSIPACPWRHQQETHVSRVACGATRLQLQPHVASDCDSLGSLLAWLCIWVNVVFVFTSRQHCSSLRLMST